MAQQTVPDLPDFLGKTARIQSVSNLIEQAQAHLQDNEFARIINGHRESDPIIVGRDDAPTYAERAKQLTEGMRALLSKNADIADHLAGEAARRRDARERAFREDDGLKRYASTPSP